MNEEQITSELAKKADEVSPPMQHTDAYPVEQPPEPRTVEEENGLEPIEQTDPFVESQNRTAISNYLGLTPGSFNALEAETSIVKILDFVKNEVGNDSSAILNYIRGIEQVMGTTLFTPSQRLNRLSQFITVRNQARILQQKQEAFLG